MVPSGEKAQLRTQSVWPYRTAVARPVATFQIRTVRSVLAVASIVPSGENAQSQIPPT
ncbi:hypothetical protein V2I01_38305 [Micromonospora sp. BRA006-A]|nr:hypothetical protein [Micromonospora sp. BRA006-A]